MHLFLQRGCKEFADVEQVTEALVVKTTIKAEHFGAFYSQSQHKSSTPCWIFVPPLTDRKLFRYQLFNLSSFNITVHWGKTLLFKVTFSSEIVHALRPFKGPFLPTSTFIQYQTLQLVISHH